MYRNRRLITQALHMLCTIRIGYITYRYGYDLHTIIRNTIFVNVSHQKKKKFKKSSNRIRQIQKILQYPIGNSNISTKMEIPVKKNGQQYRSHVQFIFEAVNQDQVTRRRRPVLI